MNCPICSQPMRTRFMTTYAVIDGKRWSYKYEEMFCGSHPQQAWQTPEQLQANLDAISAVKQAAAKLEKANRPLRTFPGQSDQAMLSFTMDTK